MFMYQALINSIDFYPRDVRLGWGGPKWQFWADQLTNSDWEGAVFAHHITNTPGFLDDAASLYPLHYLIIECYDHQYLVQTKIKKLRKNKLSFCLKQIYW